MHGLMRGKRAKPSNLLYDKSKIFLINHTPLRGEQQATLIKRLSVRKKRDSIK